LSSLMEYCPQPGLVRQLERGMGVTLKSEMRALTRLRFRG
jgi:hypothetical protein